MAKRVTVRAVTRERDTSHLIYYLFCNLRRLIRVELKPDLGRWFNRSTDLVNACFRVILSLAIVILVWVVDILERMRLACEETPAVSKNTAEVKVLKDLMESS